MEAAVSSDLSTGSVFAGRYRVEGRIAAGGMGAVYEVLHIETNRRRALKVMHAHYVSNDELRGRFRQEARVAAEIESEHIVDVFDAGIDESTGMPFLVMELLRGEDLGKRLKRTGALPKDEVIRYLHETSLALDKTHRARIVHRDLKPDNLFLCDRDHGPPRLKVLDFGIAKIVSDASTQANATNSLGTPLYMAPEQFVLRGGVSPATDIFALGMIAFTLLVGKPYWYHESKAGGGVMAFALHVATGPQESAVARARQLYGVELPEAFDGWFFRATARDSAARFQGAGEAVQALAQLLGEPLQVGMAAPRSSMPSMSSVTTSGFTPVQSTVVLPNQVNNAQGMNAPRTDPTLGGVTPSPSGSQPITLGQNSRSKTLVIGAMAGTLVLGLGLIFIIKGLSENSTNASTGAALSISSEKVVASASASVVIEPLATVPNVEPSASAAVAPTASAKTPVGDQSKARTSGNTTTKAIASPPATTTTPITKPPKKGGTWEAD